MEDLDFRGLFYTGRGVIPLFDEHPTEKTTFFHDPKRDVLMQRIEGNLYVDLIGNYSQDVSTIYRAPLSRNKLELARTIAKEHGMVPTAVFVNEGLESVVNHIEADEAGAHHELVLQGKHT